MAILRQDSVRKRQRISDCLQEFRVRLDIPKIRRIVTVFRIQAMRYTLLLSFVVLLVEDIPVRGAGDYQFHRTRSKGWDDRTRIPMNHFLIVTSRRFAV